MGDDGDLRTLLGLATEIVASFLSRNPVAMNELPALITSVFQTLQSPDARLVEVPIEKPVPVVAIRKSVMPDYIVCLEDGRKMSMLKRHLATRHDMTPEAYRQRWGLSHDYPMVAPAYAATRSTLAKGYGFGRRRKPVEAVIEPVAAALPGKPARRGRPPRTDAANVTLAPAIPKARGRAAPPTTET